MQILLGRPIRCIGCILSLLNEQSSDRQHYIRKVIGVVPFMLATLIVVTAAYGQRVPFIPNGIFFPNPGGFENLQHNWWGHRPNRAFFPEPGHQRPYLWLVSSAE